VLRVGEELFRGPLFEDHAVVHKDDAVGHFAGKAHFVRDAHHGHAVLGQIFHAAQHFVDHFRVEGGGGFVEQHGAGLHGERAGDGDTLLLPAGNLARALGGLTRDAHAAEQFHRQIRGLLLAHAPDLDRREGHVFEHGQVRVQVELLEDHAHLGAQGVHVHFRGVDARPFKEDVPLLDRLQTVQATDERALAGPGRPADDQHLALLDPLGNTFEHMELAVPFMDIPDFDQRHRFILSR